MLTHWLRGTDRSLPHHDSGLQAERTAMAWQRTALGVGGVSALLLHDAGGRLPAALPGLFGLMVTATLLVLAELRYDRIVRRVGSGQNPAAGQLALVLGGTVVLLAASAIGSIIVEGLG